VQIQLTYIGQYILAVSYFVLRNAIKIRLAWEEYSQKWRAANPEFKRAVYAAERIKWYRINVPNYHEETRQYEQQRWIKKKVKQKQINSNRAWGIRQRREYRTVGKNDMLSCQDCQLTFWKADRAKLVWINALGTRSKHRHLVCLPCNDERILAEALDEGIFVDVYE
jgi:hypothetical protein